MLSEEPRINQLDDNSYSLVSKFWKAEDTILVAARANLFEYAESIIENANRGLLLSENPYILNSYKSLPKTHLVHDIEIKKGSNSTHYQKNSLLFEIGLYFDTWTQCKVKDLIGEKESIDIYFNFFISTFKEIIANKPYGDPVREDLYYFNQKLIMLKKFIKHNHIDFKTNTGLPSEESSSD